MRISDWSSDVCSSDLERSDMGLHESRSRRRLSFRAGVDRQGLRRLVRKLRQSHGRGRFVRNQQWSDRRRAHSAERGLRRAYLADRSEEHTSELQSLMRISYAVFCLKKKIHHITLTTNNKTQHTE